MSEMTKSEYFETQKRMNNLDKDLITYEYVYPWTKEVEGIKTLPFKNVTILEGTYVLHPYLGNYYDLAFFLTLSENIQLNRIFQINFEI